MGGGDTGGRSLLTPWLICVTYPKEIALCDTNTVILIKIVFIIDT